MKNPNRLDKIAKSTGLVFGIIFCAIILIGIVFPFGIALDSKAYLQSAVSIIYPIGLFIGIKRKGSGTLVCIVSIVAFAFTYILSNKIVNYMFLIVYILIQMLPVALYILSWYYHRQVKIN
jgi:hypothetical protein